MKLNLGDVTDFNLLFLHLGIEKKMSSYIGKNGNFLIHTILRI